MLARGDGTRRRSRPYRLPSDFAPDPELVRLLLGPRLERDAAGEDGCALLEAMRLDEVDLPERRGASLVGAAGAEEVGQLEDERDEIDRDQEGEEELDVLLDRRVRLLDPFERRLAGEEVAVGLDRRDPLRDLGGLGRSARARSCAGRRRSSRRSAGGRASAPLRRRPLGGRRACSTGRSRACGSASSSPRRLRTRRGTCCS